MDKLMYTPPTARYTVQATVTVHYYVRMEVFATDRESAKVRAQALLDAWTPITTGGPVEREDSEQSSTIDRIERGEDLWQIRTTPST